MRLPPRDPCSDKSNTSSFYVKSLLQNYTNFKNSDVVSRLMYYDGNLWVDYEEGVVEAVRDCWNAMVEVEICGALLFFDFYRMLVIDFVSQVEKSVAWIDCNNRCFFPREFSGFRSFREGLGKLEIDIRVSHGAALSNKRKREEEDVVHEVKSVESFSNVIEFKKKKQEEVCLEVNSMRWSKAKLMGEGGKAYMVVKNLFLNWAGSKGIGAEISGIYKVTRTTLMDRARYDGFLNQVEITKAARGEANVTFAWIKCSSHNLERILNHGFSSPEKASLGEAYGVGVYLSPFKSTRASVMPQDAGENHVLLCRVILGKCEKVQAGSQQLYPSSPDFDTGIDDVSNPKWYIVWGANMHTHILPECVVSYRHTRNVPGQSSAKPNLTWMAKASNAMTAKFFAKLLRSLPSSKVPEFRTLCCTYKAGKVPKDIFMKKLRSAVGDQMLRLAIQEVRG